MRDTDPSYVYRQYASIVVFLDARLSSRARLNIAIDAAKRSRAHLTGVFVDLPPASRSRARSESFARGSGMSDVVEHYHENEDRMADRQRQRLDMHARQEGVSVEWRTLPASSTLDEAVAHCRYADLAVLPPALPAKYSDRPMFWSSGDIVLSAGVPCVFVPMTYQTESIAKRVTVGWNATRESRRAVTDALMFLRAADAVDVVVIDPKIGKSAHGQDPGFDIAQFLARHGVRADVQRVLSAGAEICDVLLDRAAAQKTDLLVVGAYGHAPLVEFVLGSTTRAMLERSPIPILLSH